MFFFQYVIEKCNQMLAVCPICVRWKFIKMPKTSHLLLLPLLASSSQTLYAAESKIHLKFHEAETLHCAAKYRGWVQPVFYPLHFKPVDADLLSIITLHSHFDDIVLSKRLDAFWTFRICFNLILQKAVNLNNQWFYTFCIHFALVLQIFLKNKLHCRWYFQLSRILCLNKLLCC